jgi:hypothetical protein
MKDLIRPLVPTSLMTVWRRYRSASIDRQFQGLDPAELFSAIYRKKMWGSVAGSAFCSGQGSHYDHIVRPYVEAVGDFLAEFSSAPHAADLGCGDFNVGSQIRSLCARYVASDVVPELVARNAQMYSGLDVSFECIDIVKDPLPVGEIAFLRQVLQHLSNAQILQIVPKLYQYSWVVVSEHLPSNLGFIANVDKPAGPGIREVFGSGVLLSEAPFGLRRLEQRVLCSVPVSEQSGVVQTTAYRLSE